MLIIKHLNREIYLHIAISLVNYLKFAQLDRLQQYLKKIIRSIDLEKSDGSNEQYPIKKFISQLIDVSVWEALERRHEMILPIHTESSLNLLRYRLFQYIYINLLSILIIDDRIYRVPTTILFPIYRGQCVRYQSLSVALKSNSMEQINHSCV